MTESILLVEDEPSIAEPLARFLAAEGFPTAVAPTVQAAAAAVEAAAPRLVVLDWSLPDGSGIDLLRAWRAARRDFPVIMLTARHELIDRVLGLELGADDYVVKPFEARELLARIRARLRGAAPRPEPALAAAGLELNPVTREARFKGRLLELTKMEYALLKLMLENAGKVFSREELLGSVWGYEAFITTRTIDTHILQLRHKTDPELFETVRGVGYRLLTKA
jgi:DNA-binding response OmpR family regulator